MGSIVIHKEVIGVDSNKNEVIVKSRLVWGEKRYEVVTESTNHTTLVDTPILISSMIPNAIKRIRLDNDVKRCTENGARKAMSGFSIAIENDFKEMVEAEKKRLNPQ